MLKFSKLKEGDVLCSNSDACPARLWIIFIYYFHVLKVPEIGGWLVHLLRHRNIILFTHGSRYGNSVSCNRPKHRWNLYLKQSLTDDCHKMLMSSLDRCMIQVIDKILQAFKSSQVFMSFNLRFQSKRSLDDNEGM